MTAIERLGRELEQAAARQVRVPAPRRRRRGRVVAASVLALGVSGSAAAWAANALLSSGTPIAFQRGAPIAGRADGAPIPATVKLLVDDVADPGGGPPWGLRSWETDRGFACVQVGRVYEGKLGQITDGKVFHELRLGVTRDALGGCYGLDGSGHGFVALHTAARTGAQAALCPTGFAAGAFLRGAGGRRIKCVAGERTVDFGLLGPNARSYDYRVDGKAGTGTPRGESGAYFVVQKRVKPVIREYGFHHQDPALNVRGPAEPYITLTPGSQVLKNVTYANGVCRVRITAEIRGSCDAQAGFVPIPQPDVGDLKATIRAFPAPDGRGIRVRFRAGAPVVDGRSGYTIEVRPVGTGKYMTQTYSRNIAAGETVRTTVGLYNKRRGAYRIVVRYQSVPPRPDPYAMLATPGILVGETRVLVK